MDAMQLHDAGTSSAAADFIYKKVTGKMSA